MLPLLITLADRPPLTLFWRHVMSGCTHVLVTGFTCGWETVDQQGLCYAHRAGKQVVSLVLTRDQAKLLRDAVMFYWERHGPSETMETLWNQLGRLVP